jgi:hypothetical protein
MDQEVRLIRLIAAVVHAMRFPTLRSIMHLDHVTKPDGIQNLPERIGDFDAVAEVKMRCRDLGTGHFLRALDSGSVRSLEVRQVSAFLVLRYHVVVQIEEKARHL